MSGNVNPESLADLEFEVKLSPEEQRLQAAYQKLTDSQGAFHDACADFAHEPDEETRGSLYSSVNALGTTFVETIHTVSATLPLPQRDEAIFGILKNQDTTNILCFVGLTNAEGLFEAAAEPLRDKVETMRYESDDETDFLEKVQGYFTASLQGDLNTFLQKAITLHQARKAQTINIMLARLTDTFATEDEVMPSSEQTPEEETEEEMPGVYYTFSIEPPITPHNPDFMGEDVYLSHSLPTKTFGSIWVPDAVSDGVEEEQRTEAVDAYLYNRFSRFLNPLGEMTLRMGIRHESEPLAIEEATDDSEDR